MIGLFAYIVQVTVCSKLRRYVLRLKKKEFENDRFVSMFKRHALKIKSLMGSAGRVYAYFINIILYNVLHN